MSKSWWKAIRIASNTGKKTRQIFMDHVLKTLIVVSSTSAGAEPVSYPNQDCPTLRRPSLRKTAKMTPFRRQSSCIGRRHAKKPRLPPPADLCSQPCLPRSSLPTTQQRRRSSSSQPRRGPRSTSSGTQSIRCPRSPSRTFRGATSSRLSTTYACSKRSASTRHTATCCSSTTSRPTSCARA
jgi:hypothetical protein